MIKLLANAIATLSLLAGASVASPALSADKSGRKANCPYAKQQAAKRTPAPKAQAERGIAVVEHRKLDVQILSFGP